MSKTPDRIPPLAVTVSLLAFLIAVPVEGATYYVSSSGSDTNACTQAAPCLTIARAASVANQAGDIVQVGPGVYNERVTLTRSGSAAGKITFRGHDGSGCPTSPLADGNSRGARPAPSARMQGFVVNANYIRIECFEIAGTTAMGGVDIGANRMNIDVTDTYVRGVNWRPEVGINMPAVPLGNMPRNVYVARNYVVGTEYGFRVMCADNCTFEQNEVAYLGGGPGDVDYSRIFGENITMRRNYFHGNRIADCEGVCHIDCFQSWNIGSPGGWELARNIVIDGNICFNSHQGIIVRDTTSGSSNASSFISHKGWTITNNVFAYGPEGSHRPWCVYLEHVGNVQAYNNLCLAGGWSYYGGTTGTHRNNIHVGCGWAPYSYTSTSQTPGILIADHNLLYESGRAYTGFVNDIRNRDPLFVDPASHNYRLKPGSPAIDAGTAVGLSLDLTGEVRSGPPDIGPYEYRQETAPLPPTNLQITVQ